MNDFDANLIREFRSRPAFYDRNNERFKDKVFTAREWQEISNKLGYDVSLLKDRMLQLRNRYNLEKRRIEQVREENPGMTIESPWPLFDQLHFLSEHIRARRSYKRMLTAAPQQATRMDLPSGLSNSSSGEIGGVVGGNPDDIDENGMSQMNMHAAVSSGAGFPNGFMPVRVKMEHFDDSIETNSNGCEQENSSLNGNMPSISMQAYHNHHHQQQQQQQQQQQHHHQQRQVQNENEENDTDADESECQSITDNGAFLTAQSAAMLTNKQYAFAQQQHHQRHHHRQHRQQRQQQQQPPQRHMSGPPPLKIRRIDTLRANGGTGNTWIPVPQQPKRRHSSRHSHSNSVASACASVPSSFPSNTSTNVLRTAKTKSSMTQQSPVPMYATPREQKYAAFGDFVASSLLDLPPVIAMQLIERFTTEVVKVLIENDEANENQHRRTFDDGVSNTATGGGVSSACNGVVNAAAN